MFLSDTHLPQLLPMSAYTDPAHFFRERDAVLMPAWHLVTTMPEMPRPGDFVTRQVLGHELLVHNVDGVPHAYVNVCPHRFAMLTAASRGHMPQLRCQYHGWEFAADGSTRRIPDAPSFRPLERGVLGLQALPTATCGQLVFVRLTSDGPTLEEFLGAEAEAMAAAFVPRNRMVCSWMRIAQANWKAILENNLESYHVETVHGRTLAVMPDEAACHHELGDRTSVFLAPGGISGLFGGLRRTLARSVGLTAEGIYRHCLVLPHLTWIRLDDTVVVQTFEPLAVDRTLLTFRGFSVGPMRPAPLRGWLLAAASKAHMRFWERVWDEDIRLYPAVQRGMESRHVPGQGLLSRREERINHLQAWIGRQCSRAAPAGHEAHAAIAVGCGASTACPERHQAIHGVGS